LGKKLVKGRDWGNGPALLRGGANYGSVSYQKKLGRLADGGVISKKKGIRGDKSKTEGHGEGSLSEKRN